MSTILYELLTCQIVDEIFIYLFILYSIVISVENYRWKIFYCYLHRQLPKKNIPLLFILVITNISVLLLLSFEIIDEIFFFSVSVAIGQFSSGDHLISFNQILTLALSLQTTIINTIEDQTLIHQEQSTQSIFKSID